MGSLLTFEDNNDIIFQIRIQVEGDACLHFKEDLVGGLVRGRGLRWMGEVGWRRGNWEGFQCEVSPVTAPKFGVWRMTEYHPAVG